MKEITEMKLSELLEMAAKAEENSREVYDFLAKNAKNFVVSDRFKFLADEEQKHEDFIRMLYRKVTGGDGLEMPKNTSLPIPFIRYNEDSDESDLIEQAMEAEIAARDMYLDMAKTADKEGHDGEVVETLKYLSGMEQNHHAILESELQRMKDFEQFDDYFPGMHIGP
ncbi:MAG: ferritin family protein [Thermoplasmata archaeon]